MSAAPRSASSGCGCVVVVVGDALMTTLEEPTLAMDWRHAGRRSRRARRISQSEVRSEALNGLLLCEQTADGKPDILGVGDRRQHAAQRALGAECAMAGWVWVCGALPFSWMDGRVRGVRDHLVR